MDEKVLATFHKSGSWRRRAAIALGIFCALLLIFHRPLLLGLGHRIALHYAAKENLKLEFRIEGSIFANLTIRNLHVTPTGPSDVEAIDVDLVRADYGLLGLLRHGLGAIRNLEARNARIVLNPSATPLKPSPPNPKKKITLPNFFPERVRLTDTSVVVRNQPHDFVMEHVDLDLNPRSLGSLKIDKLQLVGGQTWLKISAGTTYANRNLILSDVVLSNEERIRSLDVDASQIADGKLAMILDYPVGAGHLAASIAMTEAHSSLQTEIHLHAEKFPAGVVNKYVALPEGIVGGEITKLDVDLSGLLSAPRSWNGSVFAQADEFHQDAIAFDRAVLQFSAKDGTATLQSGEIVQGQNQIHLHGSAELPANVKDFGRSPATLEVAATTPDLKSLTTGMSQKLSGSGELNGKIDIKNAKLTADFALTAAALAFQENAMQKLTANIKASKVMPPADAKKPWYADLHSTIDMRADQVRSGDYQFDSVEGQIVEEAERVDFSNLVGRRNQNEVNIRGDYTLPEDFGTAASQPAHLSVSLNAGELSDFWATNSAWKMSGPLKVTGQIDWKNKVANGQLSILGTNVRMRDLVFQQISGEVAVVNNLVTLKDFTVRLNERDFVRANGNFSLDEPYHYGGTVAANILDLAALKPLLRASGNEKELGGSFVLNWEGTGDAKTFKNTGKLKLALEKGRWGNLQALQANVDTSYSPEGLDVPIIFLGSDKMDFQAIAQAKGETLEITKIQLDQGKAKYASGYVSVPFVWKNLGTSAPLSPANGKVAVTFQSENIDIKKLFEDFGAKPMASGSVNVKLDAKGTLAKLEARLDFQMRELRSPDLPNFDPATFDLTAQVQNNQLAVVGKLQQSKIQPLEMMANLPFDAAKIARAGNLPDDTPITAKVHLPRSSVNFIRQFAPVLEQIDGDVALDVNVKGTIGQPVLSGSGDMTVNVARSDNATVPALTNFKARLNFERDALTLQQFGGELSGGKFTVTGGIKFPKLTQPYVDLAVKADSALIARSDVLTARADADVKIVGPFNSASVTGTVAMTNSQILKNIDLIPIGLPGRPPPQPPESRPEFSFPTPPLRDWKFDVAIKTKDPFRIRGNMAFGGAVADLHLIGTGLHPGLQGTVRLENVEATLPFSRLEVAYGFLYFDPSDSLNPKMDLHGTSVIRDYIIHVYIYGTTLSPEAVFTSEPPLPQEEVISLLATGTTREELTGNNNVLAGRAATLLVQQLYRKIFKKGAATQNSSVFDRLDLDVGQTDPRTGQRQATARFKVNDQFVLLGDLDVGGGFKGMVKYLIRFR